MLIEKLRTARRVSVPLVVIETPDALACVRSIATAGELAKVGELDSVIAEWDCASGLRPYNSAAVPTVAAMSGNDEILDPVTLLAAARKSMPGTMIILHNAQRFLNDTVVMQSVMNLRDELKQNFRMLVLMGPAITLPIELQGHVVVLSEPLPDAKRIRSRMESVVKDAKLDVEVSEHAVDSQRGLIEFAVEQNTAMHVRRSGIKEDDLWESKRKQIEQTPGLQVLKSTVGFSGIGGCGVIKGFLDKILKGKRAPKAIVFIDEIEKAMAGVAGDTSGVSQDQLGTLLSHMQDTGATGVLFLGHPGAAKTAVARAAGVDAQIPTIKLDLGGAKGSLVGQSEQQLRTALKVIDAVSSGDTLWIATCNSIGVLPPELRRRFTLGTFFFDLPTEEERKLIWKIYNGGKLPKKLPECEGWTGAEIARCCDIADRLGVDLTEAAQYIVPIAISAAEQVAKLRASASGKYLSASDPGIYIAPTEGRDIERPQGRRLAVEE